MTNALHSQVIPRRPLLWLAAAFVFLAPAMLAGTAPWVPAVFISAMAAKFWLDQKDRRLRSRVWQVVLALLAFGAVIATYGSPQGIEPGVSLLVLVASLKILEAHTTRDFHVLVMIGWVLCLCAFLMSQDLHVALCVLAAFLLLNGGLLEFHRRRNERGARLSPLGGSFKLLLQALPIILLLFFLFPRGTGGMRLRLVGASGDTVGFSGQLSPGAVASVAGSEENAFRVEFPDGNIPPRPNLYWRGAVLWDGDGLNWNAGEGLGRARPSRRADPLVRQIITLEPHAGRWLFALDRAVEAPPGVNLAPGRYLRSMRPITTIRRYEVVSAPNAGEDDLHPRERAKALQPPAYVSTQMRDLVSTWTGQSSDPRAIATAALQFFRNGGFVYSLSPGRYPGADAMDDLLFNRKTGFCEHYAGAFATLMRLAGVPSRVVVGYLGGQFNEWGNYLLVRQSDAHAWCEVWLPDEGWTRIDPTSVISPERLNLGSLRDMRTTSTAPSQANAARPFTNKAGGSARFVDELGLAWDSVSYAWDSRVLSFDVDGQREFFTRFGVETITGPRLLSWSAGAIALLLAAYVAVLTWRARGRSDVVKTVYGTFCRNMARLGAERIVSEGPADFAARAAVHVPQHASDIQRITRTYIALRYSRDPTPPLVQAFAVDVRRFPRRARGE